MGKKSKKKERSLKIAETVRRGQELKQTGGKLLSLRPGQVHKSKKDYSRKWKPQDADFE